MLPSSITAIMLAVILFVGFLPSSLATAQPLQQQQTTTTPPLSITTIPPLTPEEQAQQNRLQNVIAATTRDLNETEKEVSGVVFTPRWSDVVWVNANSIAVLVAYCFPGEFADSGQEVLGGFGLEALESYAVDLPQGFMAWMAVVGNEDLQNRRLPAALGVICASELNQTEVRILSPQEQQEINNVISQFTTIQNTQITNIDQVINIINNVTTPPQNKTGGDRTTEPTFTAEIIPNATSGFTLDLFELKTKVTGGTPPYTYLWEFTPIGLYGTPCPSVPPSGELDCSLVQTYRPGRHGVSLTVTDSKNQTASDSVQITVKERPPLTVEINTNATQGYPGDTIRFDTNTVGAPPDYYCTWDWTGDGQTFKAKSFNHQFLAPGTYTFNVTVRCYPGDTASDAVQITIREQLPGGGAVGPEPEGIAPLIGGLSPSAPPLNDTGVAPSSSSEPPLRVEAIANATQAVAPATIRFDANITGGAAPYSYSWSDPNLGLIDQDRSITLNFFEPGTFTYTLTAIDSRGKVVTDNVQIVISERLPQEGIVAPEPGGVAPPPPMEQGEGGGLLLPNTPPPPPPPPPNDNEVIPPPDGGGGEEQPSTTSEEGEEQQEPTAPPPPPPSDGTEGEGGAPLSTTENQQTRQMEKDSALSYLSLPVSVCDISTIDFATSQEPSKRHLSCFE